MRLSRSTRCSLPSRTRTSKGNSTASLKLMILSGETSIGRIKSLKSATASTHPLLFMSILCPTPVADRHMRTNIDEDYWFWDLRGDASPFIKVPK